MSARDDSPILARAEGAYVNDPEAQRAVAIFTIDGITPSVMIRADLDFSDCPRCGRDACEGCE